MLLLWSRCGKDFIWKETELQLQSKSTAKQNDPTYGPYSVSKDRINPICKEETKQKIADHLLQMNKMQAKLWSPLFLPEPLALIQSPSCLHLRSQTQHPHGSLVNAIFKVSHLEQFIFRNKAWKRSRNPVCVGSGSGCCLGASGLLN